MKNILIHYVRITSDSNMLNLPEYCKNLDNENFLNLIVPTSGENKVEFFNLDKIDLQDYNAIKNKIEYILKEI